MLPNLTDLRAAIRAERARRSPRLVHSLDKAMRIINGLIEARGVPPALAAACARCGIEVPPEAVNPPDRSSSAPGNEGTP